MPGWRAGPIWRIGSPSGVSTLITSAPISPSTWVASGPSTAIATSITRIPASGPDIRLSQWLRPRRHFSLDRPARASGHPGRATEEEGRWRLPWGGAALSFREYVVGERKMGETVQILEVAMRDGLQ